MAVIECVPNVSEGRRPTSSQRLADSLRAVPGIARARRPVRRLAQPLRLHARRRRRRPWRPAFPTLFEGAIAAIDLRTHQGEHPRMGAVDVVPFIPIEGVTMDGVRGAGEVGRRRRGVAILAAGLPVRRRVDESRRGRTSKTSAAASSRAWPRRWRSPAWAPDYGPATPHPTAGATVIGARMPLIAYNINLATNRLDVAKKIAAADPHEQRRPCATSRRWAFRSKTAASSRCR